MTIITDELMQQMLSTTKNYSIVLLKPGPAAKTTPDIKKIVWEHARRNFALRAEGVLSIVCPVTAETSLSGLYIFDAGTEQATQIMEGDPAVQTGVFIFEVHPCKSFPGDSLRG